MKLVAMKSLNVLHFGVLLCKPHVTIFTRERSDFEMKSHDVTTELFREVFLTVRTCSSIITSGCSL